MIHAVASFVAIASYLIATIYQGLYLLNPQRPSPRRRFIALGIIAVVAHGISAIGLIYTSHGIDLGISRMLSLVFWAVCFIGVLNNLRRPLDTALALLFPLAAISIAISYTLQGPDTHFQNVSAGVFSHIMLSILAYSVLSLCALQALVLAVQERALKSRLHKGMLNALPPLQTMEVMLFELLWTGFALLSLAILTGAIYVESLFAQHLVHKTVFSLIAWCIFAGILWGHKQLGWRGHTAVRWTLTGFAALVLAYFGTKLVLELILHRVT
jgi:ABC-type uncharacterized transport system permease subunit